MAKVEAIYKSNSTDIVASLRSAAQKIEDGEFGEVVEAALVHNSDKGTSVYGFGKTDGASIYMLFELGKRRVIDGVIQFQDAQQ